jgi:hypothetical protein
MNQQNLKPFKPGFDPRRGSKPKGSKHVSTYIKELLEDDTAINSVDGKRYKGAPIKAIIQAAITKATGGDIRSAEFLVKYGYGPPVEDIEPQQLIITTRKHRRDDNS